MLISPLTVPSRYAIGKDADRRMLGAALVMWEKAGVAPPEFLTKSALTRRMLDAATAVVDVNPSLAMISAGNYRKGHVAWKGLDLTIETPAGAVRRGVSKDGRPWLKELEDHYGYVKRTHSEADKDHIDVFLRHDDGDHGLDSESVFVVNQHDGDGKFDEHKVILGSTSEAQARETYLRNYGAGWKGLGSIAHMTLPRFKRWITEGDTSRAVKAAASAETLYHGSPTAGLSELTPHPSRVLGGQSGVFSTPEKAMALASLARWTDDDFDQGSVNDGPFYMQEKYPGAFEKIYKGKTGTLYSVGSEGAASDDRLQRSERLHHGPTKVTGAENIPDALKALRESGLLMLRHGEPAPWDKNASAPPGPLPPIPNMNGPLLPAPAIPGPAPAVTATPQPTTALPGSSMTSGGQKLALAFFSGMTKEAGPLGLFKGLGKAVTEGAPKVLGKIDSAYGKAVSPGGGTALRAATTDALRTAAPKVQSAVQSAAQSTGQAAKWYGSEMANVSKADLAAKPIATTAKATWNAATTPFWSPALRQVAPKTDKWVGRAAAAIPAASVVGGALTAPTVIKGQATELYGQTLSDAGVPFDRAREGAHHFGEQFFDQYAPSVLPASLGGDSSAVGNFHRDVAQNAAVPWMQGNLDYVTKEGPGGLGNWLGKAVDTARSATPIGALMTGSMYVARKPHDPKQYAGIVGDALKRHAPSLATDALSGEAGRSPILNAYQEAWPEKAYSRTEEQTLDSSGDFPQAQTRGLSAARRAGLGYPMRTDQAVATGRAVHGGLKAIGSPVYATPALASAMAVEDWPLLASAGPAEIEADGRGEHLRQAWEAYATKGGPLAGWHGGLSEAVADDTRRVAHSGLLAELAKQTAARQIQR